MDIGRKLGTVVNQDCPPSKGNLHKIGSILTSLDLIPSFVKNRNPNCKFEIAALACKFKCNKIRKYILNLSA